MKIDYYKKSRMNQSESIPGINTKKINESMWIIFTDKVSEINF